MKGVCVALLLTACAVSARSPMRPSIDPIAPSAECHMTAESGLCEAYMPRYHYSDSTGDCEMFIYGGCGGNGNNFESKQECLNTCRPASAGNLCTQNAEPGLCMAYMPKFFYNSTSGACEKFIYGGCGGNDNKFDTQEDCQRECQHTTLAPAVPEVCEMPSEPGLCRGYFPMFFYNSETGACEKFIYGGCGGNDNKFHTQEDCQSQCAKTAKNLCEMPSEPGMCRGYFPKYFYNSETGACEKFIYGGCGGNDNKFDTQEDCQSACA